MCYFHPYPPNHPTLGRYLPNPTYMAKPTYLVVIPIDPQQSKTTRKNKMKILHET